MKKKLENTVKKIYVDPILVDLETGEEIHVTKITRPLKNKSFNIKTGEVIENVKND